jgi:hypothetical protein
MIAPSAALAARCTLLPVKKASEAALVVYFTRFLTEDKTEGKYKICRVVKKAETGTQTFFVTPFRQDANLVVHESNWPK